MKNEKRKKTKRLPNIYYFFVDGEPETVIDARSRVDALMLFKKRGYLLDENVFMVEYNRTTKKTVRVLLQNIE